MMHREHSFEQAALPFLGSLYQAAFCMVHDQAIATRCVEQAYLEAGRAIHLLNGVTGCRVLLFAKLFRFLHKRQGALAGIKGWLTGGEGAEAPAEADLDEMLRALHRLPETLREILLLADVEEFSKSEIQEVLGVSSKVLTRRLAEGRERFRSAWKIGEPMDGPSLEDPAVA